MPRTTTKLSTLFQVPGGVVTLEIGLVVTVTEINKKVQKQDLKNIKECKDGMPNSMQTR